MANTELDELLGPYGVEVLGKRPDPYTAFSTRLQLPGANPQSELVRGLGSSIFPTPRAMKAGLDQILGTAFGIPGAWDVNQQVMEMLPEVPNAVAQMVQDPRGLGALLGMLVPMGRPGRAWQKTPYRASLPDDVETMLGARRQLSNDRSIARNLIKPTIEPKRELMEGPYRSFNRFELRVPKTMIEDMKQPGDAQAAAQYWQSRIKRPKEATPDAIRAELRETGGWQEEDLLDDDMNWQRILWIAGSMDE